MEQLDEMEDRNALRRLRCIRQIADADEETLGIVSSVLDRVLPPKAERKKRGPRRHDEEKGGPV
jgi:hypothetical protein